MTLPEFMAFSKIPRLGRDMVVTEKIDGTNAQILITKEGGVFAGSRSRWITPLDDNYGFARWVEENRAELLGLGPGRHFGEWWGDGIQRRYNQEHKRFSLFNTSRWNEKTPPPDCCSVVPELGRRPFHTESVDWILAKLAAGGSVAAPGFMNPEGVVVFHCASGHIYKKTLGNDGHKESKYDQE